MTLRLRLPKAATPDTALTVVVPERVDPPGLLSSATVMARVSPVTVLPNASCTATRTGGAMGVFTEALDGCTVKASRVGAPALTLKAAEEAPVSPAALPERVYPAAARSTDKSLKTATPALAERVSVPERVPPAGLERRARVMELVAVGTVLPKASCTVTSTDGLMKAPATTLEGWTVKASRLGAPALMLKF